MVADTTAGYCLLRNVQDLLADEKTPHERRFGDPLKGPGIPFGSMVEYHPFFSAKEQSTLHQFGEKISPGTLLGHALFAGEIWKGDLMVADIEELEKMDASEIHAWRLIAKTVFMPKNGEHFIFPIADGTVQMSGRDQVVRKSTSIQDYPERGEVHNDDLR